MRLPSPHPWLMSVLREPHRPPPDFPDTESDWDRVIADAEQHRVLPILYRLMITWPESRCRIPHDRLKARLVHHTARAMFLCEELSELLRLFQRHAVACMPLRGPALGEWLYGDGTARPIEDLDLLVRRQDLDRITGILVGLGYDAIDCRPGFARSFYYTLEFVRDDPALVVEPHWTIAYPPFADQVDMEAVWARSMIGHVCGVDSRLLASTDLLLHLSWHLLHWQERAPLLWFYDLDRLIRKDGVELDWAEVATVAAQSGQEILVAEALRALTILFDTPVPGGTLARLTRPTSGEPRSLSKTIRRNAITLLAGRSELRGREQFALFVSLKGIRAKARYAWSLLFPSPEFMRFRYPADNNVELAWRYITRAAHLLWEGIRWVADLAMVRKDRLSGG